ncbi:FIST signal transduction protein [Leptolyngbya sp. AN02str]|uniref:FIST signal transduction protein n=1 Tax=Leptolyngbya sp. AN02str TaxID=3423363 RepID=UPI003D323C18
MKIEQALWSQLNGWVPSSMGDLGAAAQLVLLFGSPQALQTQSNWANLRQHYSNALILGCSTAGEICDTRVYDESLVATAIQFEHSQVKGYQLQLQPGESSMDVGDRLGRLFDPNGLVHVFLLSDGLQVNGSELVRGLVPHLPLGVTVTGGLSGDGDRFQQTLVLLNDDPQPGRIAAVGLYGDRLKVGYGSLGGWIPFGPERTITQSRGNVLYQLDGQSALELYKKYLGEHAAELPASGLLFPLSLHTPSSQHRLVRTILSINEDEQSMTFAGDMPEGATAQLMHASFDRLVDGAIAAAETCATAGHPSPELAILISCVGRKLLLKQRIEEEVEGVRDMLGSGTVLTGFYSYGEIAPFTAGAPCELHNQTMTVTTFTELS